MPLGRGVYGASENGQSLLQFLAGDDEGHEGADAVAVLASAEEQEPFLEGGLDHLRGPLLVGGAALCVLDELHRGHRAPATHVANEIRVPVLDLAHRGHDALADDVGTREEVFLLEGFEHGEGGGAGYRVAAVSGAKAPDVDGVHDLRRGNDVRLDPRVLNGEHLARPAETRLDLVYDHHDAVLVAQLPQSPHVEVRERYEAALPTHRFDDDRRDAARVHRAHERLLDGREAVAHAAAGTIPARRAAVRVGRRDPVDLGYERPEALLVGIRLSGEGHREHSTPVEGVLEGYDRRTPHVVTCDLGRVLDSLGP